MRRTRVHNSVHKLLTHFSAALNPECSTHASRISNTQSPAQSPSQQALTRRLSLPLVCHRHTDATAETISRAQHMQQSTAAQQDLHTDSMHASHQTLDPKCSAHTSRITNTRSPAQSPSQQALTRRLSLPPVCHSHADATAETISRAQHNVMQQST